jgi:hypothetical protein
MPAEHVDLSNAIEEIKEELASRIAKAISEASFNFGSTFGCCNSQQ